MLFLLKTALLSLIFCWLVLLPNLTPWVVGAAELAGLKFQTEVVEDSRVWIVEFFSPMCGSCQEFASIWEKVEANMKTIRVGKINIDDPNGAALAKSLGVLEEGVPNIRLFSVVGNGKGISIMNGDTMLTGKQIMTKVRSNVLGHEKRGDGFMLKKS